MITGYTRPLYILPFDHRHSYIDGLFHWKEPLSPGQAAEVATSKEVIYEGFTIAAAKMPDRAGILVDEEFGAGILRDASARAFITCVSTEKSGQDEFDFEYGDQFARHIEAVNPTFAKVLVRYDARGDNALNARQTARLRRLTEYLSATRRLFIFELLVPPDPAPQAALLVEAIRQCQDAGVEPDVWKIEGLDERRDAELVVETARRGGRDTVGCIVLGRGSDEQAVLRWLKTAAGVPGFIGFAIGRTTWWDAIAAWQSHTVSREAAAAKIAARFQEWADVFERERPSRP
jgi:myo-inositol catabolism protein IolC